MSEQTTVDFRALGLAEPLLKAIEESGYTTPTPIQAQAIPLALERKDLMAGAQTGTGKTAAFSLPILHTLLPLASTSTSPAKHPIRALVLAPTRELAIQVYDNIKTYAKHTPLRSLVVYGGVDIKTQTPILKTGVEILVATPGRLLDHVEQKTLSLNQVQFLVLDEADRMLDMGFMPDLKRILALLPKQRQNLMFSATFSDEIKKLADAFLNQPTLIEVARSNATNDNVEQKAYLVNSDRKQRFLVQLLKQYASQQVIIFTKTKLSASRLARALERDEIPCTAIHGDKSQKERIEALDAFKAGSIHALVATDVAARGLDISDLPLVINYEISTSPEDYVHRIGRTGRAGAKGVAISLIDEEETKYFDEIEKLIKKQIPKEKASGSAASAGSSRPVKSAKSLKKEDAWFYQPYEPSSAAATVETPKVIAPVAKPSTAKRKVVAALLGGFGFKAAPRAAQNKKRVAGKAREKEVQATSPAVEVESSQ
ncbi:Superfamily II DNA and RNA helicase [Methylophilus rhizosphaerae]|uniref:DEAD-box ATP-dependent RNA helicase RhpA n=1 Tax=Methylophilus rhizosphaerae TaxID=492660 RepID=A0A1G9AWA1_9PROT|nr:DEAD/DEAH box helicase [Methylophilus rhizosphaerae]SDK31513.1 Superfamily II DNA and RNA helicase [Methylophilus rhizosphaerae]